MSFDPRTIKLGGYRPRTWRIECRRCKRGVVLDRYDMQRRYGDNITLAECATKIAALKGCNLAAIHGGPGCSVEVFETSVASWGQLSDARYGKWQAFLTCHRRFSSLKAAGSCPEHIQLDVSTLVAVLGHDYPLDRLQSKCKCPMCGTAHIEIEWFVPGPPSTPAPINETPPSPLRLRPQGAELAGRGLGVLKGGRDGR